jgi:hypothetical protein
MSLLLGSSGGGIITLQEPTTATNRTLTLPDVTGTLAHVNGRWEFIGTGATLNATLSFTNIGSYSEIIALVYFGNDDNNAGTAMSVSLNLSSNNGSTYGANRELLSVTGARYDAFNSVRISNTNVVGNKTISPFLARRTAVHTTTTTENVVTGTINALRFVIGNSTNMVMAVSLFGVP